MSKLVLDVAQMIEDDFEQSYRPANSFFTIEDYATKVVDEKNSELEREFLVQYQQNKRKFPIINPMWLKTIFVDVTKDEGGEWSGLICEPLFEFPFDELGTAIQKVSPSGSNCAEFVRISHLQSWQICQLPPTQTNFYSVEGCKLVLHNFFGCCEKLTLSIVPSQAALPLEQQTVPDGKVAQIREVVLNQMWRNYQIKLGKISEHNDNNRNPNPNESSMVYENVKTK